MRIGVIFCAWQSADLLSSSLTPWVEAKASRIGGHEFQICAVSVPFEGFPQDEERDITRSILGGHAQRGEIDHVIVTDKPLKETEARGRALRWLMEQGVDIVWQHDADEIASQQDIVRIAAFVEANPWIVSFRLSLRNAVFTPTTFLADPFTPMRIHRLYTDGGYVADGFWDDNNVRYTRPWERDKMGCPVVHDVQMASMTVPTGIAWPVHLTWLNDERSRRKVAYQTLARGWECSFRWDEAKGLQFNEAYYAKRGLPLPEVVHD